MWKKQKASFHDKCRKMGLLIEKSLLSSSHPVYIHKPDAPFVIKYKTAQYLILK